MDHLNPITTLALLSWPIVAFFLYKTRPIAQATLWTILGAYMLLPVGAVIKFKMIPQFDKDSIACLSALLGSVIVSRRRIKFFHGFGLAEVLFIVMMLCPFVTSELNGDAIRVGPTVLPGLGSYDAGSAVIFEAISLIPFFLGRQILCSTADTKEIMRVFVVAGLIYSLPALFEVRFSPQLHTWIYGYFPPIADFDQQMRDNGFRPVVFMGHGLLVSFFFCTTAIAATTLRRTNIQALRTMHLPPAGIVAYLSVVLVLCKTASSIIYGALLIPLVSFTRPRVQLVVAISLVTVALLYPTLRSTNLIPTETALGLAASISPDREGSLAVRFANEDELLKHASQRFWFGWGRFGRSRIHNQWGSDISLTDGTWIITLGIFGFVGFLAEFGLLTLPVFAAARALRFAESIKDKVLLSSLSVILAINVFDLLPNSSLRPWTWLIAGALLGQAEALRRSVRLSREPFKQGPLDLRLNRRPGTREAWGMTRSMGRAKQDLRSSQ